MDTVARGILWRGQRRSPRGADRAFLVRQISSHKRESIRPDHHVGMQDDVIPQRHAPHQPHPGTQLCTRTNGAIRPDCAMGIDPAVPRDLHIRPDDTERSDADPVARHGSILECPAAGEAQAAEAGGVPS